MLTSIREKTAQPISFLTTPLLYISIISIISINSSTIFITFHVFNTLNVKTCVEPRFTKLYQGRMCLIPSITFHNAVLKRLNLPDNFPGGGLKTEIDYFEVRT